MSSYSPEAKLQTLAGLRGVLPCCPHCSQGFPAATSLGHSLPQALAGTPKLARSSAVGTRWPCDECRVKGLLITRPPQSESHGHSSPVPRQASRK